MEKSFESLEEIRGWISKRFSIKNDGFLYLTLIYKKGKFYIKI